MRSKKQDTMLWSLILGALLWVANMNLMPSLASANISAYQKQWIKSFEQDEFFFHMYLMQDGGIFDESRMEIKIFDSSHQFSAEWTVDHVELFMPQHHHGSAPTQVIKIADGHFLVKEAYFFMEGYWEIRVILKGRGKTVTLTFDYQVSNEDHHGHHH